MNKVCSGYTGIVCIDGSCPKANVEEYINRFMDIVKDCADCIFYKGCEDCAFNGTELCEKA